MSRWSIIIGWRGDHAAAADVLAQRIENHWPPRPSIRIKRYNLDAVDAETLNSADAIILTHGPGETLRNSDPSIAALEQIKAPLLAVLPAGTASETALEYINALILDETASEEMICSTLHGMLHRQEEVRELQEDLSLVRRFHGGLEDEIVRMHEELQLAAMIQREMLPREIPSLHGINFAAMWRPAHYVSGDLYDITRLDEDHIAVFITDAVGHGVPAALMTMVINRSLTMKEVDVDSYRIVPPSEVLHRLNAEMIRRQGRTTRFATAVYAVVNCRLRTVQLAGAGHPPPLLLRGDGSQVFLQTEGGLLGVFEDETYDQIEFTLSMNDRMILYSDGFEQAFPNTQSDAYQRKLPNTRYRDEFEQLRQPSDPDAMVEHIRERLDAQCGSLHQLDDLTLVCMDVGALPAAAYANEDVAAGAGSR